MTGFKTFICSRVYFHFHTDDGLSRNRNVCTYCYAHKIMKFITFALVFSFILCCWPKTNIIEFEDEDSLIIIIMTNQQQTTNSVLVLKLFILCNYTCESANIIGGAAESVSLSKYSNSGSIAGE